MFIRLTIATTEVSFPALAVTATSFAIAVMSASPEQFVDKVCGRVDNVDSPTPAGRQGRPIHTRCSATADPRVDNVDPRVDNVDLARLSGRHCRPEDRLHRPVGPAAYFYSFMRFPLMKSYIH